jgi:biotin operon repressor
MGMVWMDGKKPAAVSWMQECKKVFETGDSYTLEQMRDALVGEGVAEALDKGASNSISATMSKLKKSGYLVIESPGNYRKAQQ